MRKRSITGLIIAVLFVSSTPALSVNATSASQLAPSASCKLSKFDNPNSDPVGTGYLGFPTPTERLNTSKTINAAIIGVDFSDLQSKTPNPKIDYEYITKPITQWYSVLSNGKMKFNWRFNAKYVRMSQKLSYYNIGGSTAGTGKTTIRADEFIKQAISLSDKDFDFENIDLVVIAPPLNTTGDQVTNGGAYPMVKGDGYKYSGGEVLNATIINVQEISSRKYPPWFGGLPLAHEIGHLTGLTDLYNTSWSQSKEKSEAQFKYMGIFSYMNFAGANGNAIYPTIWEQWQVGWLKDSHIRCVKNLLSSIHEISNLETTSSNPKGVVVPISATKAIVVESRRKVGYDSTMPASAEGALVYTLDTLASSGTGALRVVRKVNSKKILFEDAPLKSGEYVDILGYRIKNESMKKNSDIISIVKIDGKLSNVPNPTMTPKFGTNTGSSSQNKASGQADSLSVQALGGFGTSRTEGYVEFTASALQSFKIQISTLGTEVEIWNSGIVNSTSKTSKVPVSNLKCGDRYRISMTIYSNPDGQGESKTTTNDGMLSAINCS